MTGLDIDCFMPGVYGRKVKIMRTGRYTTGLDFLFCARCLTGESRCRKEHESKRKCFNLITCFSTGILRAKKEVKRTRLYMTGVTACFVPDILRVKWGGEKGRAVHDNACIWLLVLCPVFNGRERELGRKRRSVTGPDFDRLFFVSCSEG